MIGLGQAGVVALCAAATDERVHTVAALESPAALATAEQYMHRGRGWDCWRQICLRSAMFRSWPHSPSRDDWSSGGAVTPQDKKLSEKDIKEAYRFTRKVYDLYKAADKLTLRAEGTPEEVAAILLQA